MKNNGSNETSKTTRYVLVHPKLGVFLGISEDYRTWWSVIGGIQTTVAPTAETEESAKFVAALVENVAQGLWIHPVETEGTEATASELRASGLSDDLIGVLSHPAWNHPGGTA